MQRGFTKAWRKELESDIWLMPPLYHRVWFWLRQKVQHEPYLFPTRQLFGIWVLPGQRLTSLEDISEGVKWFENRRESKADRKSIKRVLDWLAFQNCIELTCHTSGTLIVIVNWHTYNTNNNELATLDKQLGNTSSTVGGHKKRMIKNVKNEEEVKPKVKRFVPPSVEEVHIYMREIGYQGDAEKWVNFYQGKGWMIGKNKMQDWKAAVRTWKGNDKTTQVDTRFTGPEWQ